jgi:hypothetical protein
MSDRGTGYHESPSQTTMGDLAEEIVRAREKFPRNGHMLAALMEEVGEEAIQVACVALRIAEEGDADFPGIQPSRGFYVYGSRSGGAVESRPGVSMTVRIPGREGDDA